MLFLIACTAASLDPLSRPDALDQETLVMAFGEVRTDPDGDPAALSTPSSTFNTRLEAVDWLPDQVQVRWSDPKVELDLWVPRHDLQTWTTEEVWAEAGEDTGVWIPAWMPLNREGRAGDLVAVSHYDGLIEAFVPEWTVDEVRPRGTEPPDVASIPGVWFLHAEAPVLDAWDGQPFAQVPSWPDGFSHTVEVVAQQDGQSLIWWDAEFGHVHGWVDDRDLLYAPNRGVGWSSPLTFGCGGYGFMSPMPNLDAGTLLHDPDGNLVGEVLQDAWFELGPVEEDGWRWVAVETPWGDLELWTSADQP